MGQLILPPSGLVYVDANVVIYSVEKIEPYWTLLQPMWQACQAGQISLVSSELLFLETLVKPIREFDNILENIFRQLLLDSQEFQLVPINLAILDSAAHLRAKLNLKPPDAIHAATALELNCALFLTNDGIFQRVPNLPVAILKSML